MSKISDLSNPRNTLPAEVIARISAESQTSSLHVLISQILSGFRDIGSGLRDGIFSSSKIGSQNTFGDNQLDVDVKTDEILFNYLIGSGLVHVAASEETPVERNCEGSGFSVGFDPLDGSSIVDANFAVGSILGIWPGYGLLNRTGREQSASMVAQYGPRVTVALAFNKSATASGEYFCCELTMLPDSWTVSIPQLTISKKAKTFAPGNLRATSDNASYRDLVNYWISHKYTLRYSGGLVPDVYHILIKGEGVLSNASSKSARAKLRLVFEASPIALIVEAAGGLSCACSSEVGEAMAPTSILDVSIDNLDRRVGVCYGSEDEVERFKAHIFSS